MKVTKYLHSCLLVEDNGKVAIIDPDMFTYQQKVFDISFLKQLDYILVTHSHFDHMSIPFIKELVAKFPKVKIFSNQEVVDALQKEGIKGSTSGNEDIVLIPVKHEKMFGNRKMEENTQFDVFGKLSHPGDSLSSTSTKEVFALPITAPWGSTTWAVEVAEKLKPKVIIPIHDYLWKDEVVGMFEGRIAEYFKEKGIDFKVPKVGEAMEI